MLHTICIGFDTFLWDLYWICIAKWINLGSSLYGEFVSELKSFFSGFYQDFEEETGLEQIARIRKDWQVERIRKDWQVETKLFLFFSFGYL